MASGTTLTDVFGIGPIIAAMLIGFSGDIDRFVNRDRYAACNTVYRHLVADAARTRG